MTPHRGLMLNPTGRGAPGFEKAAAALIKEKLRNGRVWVVSRAAAHGSPARERTLTL